MRISDWSSYVCSTDLEASIFRNNSETLNKNHFLKIKLKGAQGNTFGIGAKVILYHGDVRQYQEMIPVRGFQSSVNYELVFGLGDVNVVDSLEVVWPESSVQKLYGVRADRTILISQADAVEKEQGQRRGDPIFEREKGALGIDFVEAEVTLS